MTPVSAYEFFRRNGRIYINGNLIEFISYEDYLDYLS
nr:MAG TPA: pepsin inhibitor [Caudoviricetes sp.]